MKEEVTYKELWTALIELYKAYGDYGYADEMTEKALEKLMNLYACWLE